MGRSRPRKANSKFSPRRTTRPTACKTDRLRLKLLLLISDSLLVFLPGNPCYGKATPKHKSRLHEISQQSTKMGPWTQRNLPRSREKTLKVAPKTLKLKGNLTWRADLLSTFAVNRTTQKGTEEQSRQMQSRAVDQTEPE